MNLASPFRNLRAWALFSALAAGACFAADETYFTKVGFSYEKGRHITTNYFKGTRVPVNTEVKVVDKSRGAIKLEIPGTHETVQLKNEEKYTKVPIDSIFSRYLSKEKTPESEFSPAFLEDIKAGKVTVGMTKKDVLASVGYPPAHKTPSLEGDEWRYWVHRFGTTLVTFKDGKVSEVKQ